MTKEEFFEDYESLDKESQRILLGAWGNTISLGDSVAMQKKDFYRNKTKYNNAKNKNFFLGETQRGMNNVSPLVAYKFYNRTVDETFNIYYPDAENLRRGNTNVVTDVGVPTTKFDFHTETYYFDNNHNGKFGDTGDTLAFKLLLFVSTDGLKVKECYEVTEPKDDEVILFLETDGGLSKQVLYAKMSEKVRKQFTDKNGNLKTNLYDNEFMKGVRKHYSDANQEVIEELIKKGYIEGSVIKEGFFKVLKYLSIGSTALPKLIGWILEKLGDGIDLLKIEEQYWDTEKEDYFLKKENVIKQYTISTEALKKIKELFNNKKELSVTDLIPDAIEEAILYILQKVENILDSYNRFVKQKIEEIYKNLDNPTSNFIFQHAAEAFAFLAGFWNGAVDFVSGIFKFVGTLLQAPFNLVTNLDDVLEMVDNFWDAVTNKDFWSNLWDNMVATFQKIVKDLKELKLEDLNWVRIAYFSGYGLAFIVSFFVPIANIANLAKLKNFGKLGEIIAKFTEEISNGFVKGANIVSQKSAQAYQNSVKIFGEILELIKNGGENLYKFFNKIWKKIVDWFVKNKKYISILEELLGLGLSKETIAKLKGLGLELKIGKGIVVNGISNEKYIEIYHKGVKIFEGLPSHAADFSKKLEKMSKEAAEKYLDDLLNKLNKFLPENCDIIFKDGAYNFKDLSTDELVGLVEVNSENFLEFAIYRKGLKTKVSGQEVFNSLIEHLKIRKIPFKGIKGLWSGASDNVTKFNEAIENGLSAEKAAFKTWTGERASEHGFDKVLIEKLEPHIPPYTKIYVKFYK